jgi:hypothetical protein
MRNLRTTTSSNVKLIATTVFLACAALLPARDSSTKGRWSFFCSDLKGRPHRSPPNGFCLRNLSWDTFLFFCFHTYTGGSIGGAFAFGGVLGPQLNQKEQSVIMPSFSPSVFHFSSPQDFTSALFSVLEIGRRLGALVPDLVGERLFSCFSLSLHLGYHLWGVCDCISSFHHTHLVDYPISTFLFGAKAGEIQQWIAAALRVVVALD